MSSIPIQTRDLRLDFFRGLALLTILVNHIPYNPLGEITPRNFGFSDATEVFIFLSGFAAAMTYGRVMEKDGYKLAAARIAKRVWQLFVAHIFMLMVFCALVTWAADATGNPKYLSDMFVGALLTDPGHVLMYAPILGFQPAFMNILPMYIGIMILFIPMLALLRVSRVAFLAASLTLYAVVAINNINLPVFPKGVWYFNPLAWQVLFMLGALFGYKPAHAANWVPQGRAPLIVAVAYLTFSLVIVMSWRSPALAALIPQALKDIIYPLSKTNLSVWRLTHFLATAYIALRFVPPGAAWLKDRMVDPILACGRHALEVFCFGILLSFLGRLVMLEISKEVSATLIVNFAAFAATFSLAYLLDWYKTAGKTAKVPAIAPRPVAVAQPAPPAPVAPARPVLAPQGEPAAQT